MICLDTLHVGLSRFLLRGVGLWPYQRSILVRLQLILLLAILISFILFQLTVFVTSKCTPDLFINVLSSASFYLIFVIKYMAFINNKMITHSLESLYHTYNDLTDENEVNILEQCSNCAKRYTIALLILAIPMTFFITIYLFWPYIFNILFFTNETQPRFSLPFMIEYFVDQKQYFCLILFHADAAFNIGIAVMIATGAMLIFHQQHACGMFRIASYRIERAMTFEYLQENNLADENSIFKGLIYAIDMHRKAMKYSDMLSCHFQMMFAVMTVVEVIGVSLSIYQIVTFGYNIAKLLIPVSYITVQFLYLMICHYFAQQVTDSNNDVFITVYKVHWYMAPLQIQKLILFLLQKSTKPFVMAIGGLLTGSLQSASSLLSTALSYFIFLHSTQH